MATLTIRGAPTDAAIEAVAAGFGLVIRGLAFATPANDRQRVDIGVRMLQRLVQSRDTLTVGVPGVERRW